LSTIAGRPELPRAGLLGIALPNLRLLRLEPLSVDDLPRSPRNEVVPIPGLNVCPRSVLSNSLVTCPQQDHPTDLVDLLLSFVKGGTSLLVAEDQLFKCGAIVRLQQNCVTHI